MTGSLRRPAALGYLVFETAHLDDWAVFARDLLGTVVEHGDEVRLRTDGAPFRVLLRRGPATTLVTVGWEYAGPVEWAAAVAAVGQRVPVLPGDSDRCAERSVPALASFVDPSGVTHELVWGRARVVTRPFVPGPGVTGFVDGVGHVVVRSDRAVATREFLIDALDLQVSDFRGGAWFLRCNHRHHAIALVEAPRVETHHFMLEVADLDDVGRAHDRARAAGALARGLGRHSNDRMFSCYLRAPGGLEVEYGWGGRSVSEGWIAHEIDGGDSWGHEPILEGS